VAHIGEIRPAPALPAPGGSIDEWLWLCLALAVLIVCGLVLASRR
jgi:hypothetical protein